MKNTTFASQKSSLSRAFGATLLCSSLLAFGCTEDESQGPDGAAKGIPTADMLAIKVPGGQTRAVGDLAEHYAETRDIANEINGSTAWALQQAHLLMQGPGNLDGRVTTWGPFTGGSVEYKAIATERADGGYDYQLVARAAGSSGAFETLLSGTSILGADGEPAKGKLTVDFEADDRVSPGHRTETGKVVIDYDLAQHSLAVEVSAREGGSTSTVRHTYKGANDGSGELLFVVSRDAASVSIRSRWQAGGAGRGDARITSGEIGQPEVTESQCWDNQYKLTYSMTQVGTIVDSEGSAASCVFASAELPPRS